MAANKDFPEDSFSCDGGDDVGWWDCSLCTYKNSADKFKCEMCDFRRGTSTRKPRCNADTNVVQVLKQQEQIRQQTRATKTPKVRSSTSSNVAVSSALSSAVSSAVSSVVSSAVSSVVSSAVSSATLDEVLQPSKFEVSGNLIKYSPPTSSGRTGLIIDKKRFTSQSVTVNDVTITFTEYATRQNNYVRKKKKRRDASRSRSSTGKNHAALENEQSDTSSDNTPSTATEEY